MIKQLLLISLGLVLALTLSIYFLQRYLIYVPAKVVPTRQEYNALDMQEIQLTTSDGLRLLAWYKPAIPSMPTVLVFHGNAGDIGNRMPLARPFIASGFGVLLLEYRGYGGNPGSPNESGLYTDGAAAMEFLRKQSIKDKLIVLYGESLGTGVATKIATQYPVCAVVLQSPYTSLVSLARQQYSWIPLKPWDKFDSLSRIKSIKAPLLILHGEKDTLVPFDEGLTLFNNALSPKKMVAIPERGHNGLWDAKFFNEVIPFIRNNCSDTAAMREYQG